MNQEATDRMFIEIAHVIGRQSKCVSLKVGAVLTMESRVISTGYNGSPPGFINCCDQFPHWLVPGYVPTLEDRKAHTEWQQEHEIHAEMNAFAFASRYGISTKGATLYCTYCPCHQCVKNAIMFGVSRIVFDKFYREMWKESTKKMVAEAEIQVSGPFDCGIILQPGKNAAPANDVLSPLRPDLGF